MNRDTKILIPEVPGDWTARIRAGHTNIWNEALHGSPHRNGLPELRLDPPELGLFAERIDGAWYWVCGCAKCLADGSKWSYITCFEHNRCNDCGTHRQDLTETPWGIPDGFRCVPCQDALVARLKEEALARATETGHSEEDCWHTDDILCPHCASKQSAEERHEDEKEAECEVCGGLYSLELRYSVSYTTKVARKAAA